MDRWQVCRYSVSVKRKLAAEGHVRAAFLTDLHNSRWGRKYELLLDALALEEPDLLLVGGDIITAVPGVTTEFAEELMADLAARYPVYYGFGNHEYRLKLYPETYGDLYGKYISSLRKSGVVVLANAKAQVSVCGIPLSICGFNVRRRFYKRFRKETMPVSEIGRIFGTPDRDAVSILLAHSPKYIETYLKWGADLTLCGHYHGGMARLPNGLGLIDPDLSLFSARAKGRFDHRGRTCIVSAGLGEHSIQKRINNPREITIVDITVGS